MTRNQKRKRRVHRRREWHFRKWDRRFMRECTRTDGRETWVDGHAYMKLWHPEDKFYSFARCRWEPMPPYRSPAWLTARSSR